MKLDRLMSLGNAAATLSLLTTISIFEILLPYPVQAAEVDPRPNTTDPMVLTADHNAQPEMPLNFEEPVDLSDPAPGLVLSQLAEPNAELPSSAIPHLMAPVSPGTRLAPNSSAAAHTTSTTAIPEAGMTSEQATGPELEADPAPGVAQAPIANSPPTQRSYPVASPALVPERSQPDETAASAFSLDSSVPADPALGELQQLSPPALTSPSAFQHAPATVPSTDHGLLPQAMAQANNVSAPGLQLERIDLNFSQTQASGGKDKLFINPIVHFRLPDRSRLRLTTGVQTFDDDRASDTVTNYPVHLDWTKVLRPGTRLELGGGIEFFDRLSTSGYFNAALAHNIPLSVDAAGKPLANLRLSGTVNFSPLKANARSLEQEISRWLIQPRLVWRLDSRTRIINDLRLGFYSDGNTGFAADNRIIHDIPAGDIGVFSIGAEISNHTFEDDTRGLNGFETAQDFLAYRLLLGWRGKIADPLTCNVGVDLGRRRVRGDFTNASGYRAQCDWELPEQFTLQVGFKYSQFDDADGLISLEETSQISARLSRRF